MFKKHMVTLLAVVSLLTLWTIPAAAECNRDSDCMGDRICVDGSCVFPQRRRTYRRRGYRYSDRRRRPRMRVEFGASVMTGPAWLMFASGPGFIGGGSIADILIMNADINMGVCLNWPRFKSFLSPGRGFRLLIGMGFRPLITKAGATYDIYFFKIRTKKGLFTSSAGLGLHTGGGGNFFALQAGFGLGFDVGRHVAINIDMLDISTYYKSGATLFLINSLLGVSLHF